MRQLRLNHDPFHSLLVNALARSEGCGSPQVVPEAPLYPLHGLKMNIPLGL